MADSYDIIIIGAGIMGSSTAYYLSQTGKKVLLIDQYDIANDHNASQDYSRVFRYVYGSDRFYTLLAIESLRIWKSWEKSTGTQLYFPTGCLLLGNGPSSYAIQSLQVMKKLNLPIELLEGKAFKKRFPQFSGPAGVFDLHGGVLEASTAVKVLVKSAKEDGVKVWTKIKVMRVAAHEIELSGGTTLSAESIVVTAGAWTKKLLRTKIPIVPSRQDVIYIRPTEQRQFDKAHFPIFGHLESGFYGIPMHGINAVKIANHYPGGQTDPDKRKGQASISFIKQCKKFLHTHIPELAKGKIVKTKICLYDMTPNGDFLIDRLNDGIIIGAGFSGHGFKFAPVIGKILADLAIKGKTTYDIERFRIR